MVRRSTQWCCLLLLPYGLMTGAGESPHEICIGGIEALARGVVAGLDRRQRYGERGAAGTSVRAPDEPVRDNGRRDHVCVAVVLAPPAEKPQLAPVRTQGSGEQG